VTALGKNVPIKVFIQFIVQHTPFLIPIVLENKTMVRYDTLGYVLVKR
jgi:hypothetical protein